MHPCLFFCEISCVKEPALSPEKDGLGSRDNILLVVGFSRAQMKNIHTGPKIHMVG
jgi:hypothetical protein